MRLVRRALTGAAASLALGALFTGVALGAEPTAEADANAVISIGLGADDDATVDLGLDGILDLTDGATDAVLDLDGAAAFAGGSATDSSVDAAVTVGGIANADAGSLDLGSPEGEASLGIDLDATRASLAGAGMNAGSVLLIDLDAGRADAIGGSADAAATIGADADSADADVSVSLGTDADSANADVSVWLGADTDAMEGAADANASLALGVGTDADSGVNALLSGLGGIEGLSLDSLSAGAAEVADVAGASSDAGSVDPTGAVDAMTGLIRGTVLGIQDTGPDAAPTGGNEPTDATPSITGGGAAGGGFLPDTAFTPGRDVVLWGLPLVILAGLWASAGALRLRRR